MNKNSNMQSNIYLGKETNVHITLYKIFFIKHAAIPKYSFISLPQNKIDEKCPQ